jgi:hypothetical protein
MNEHDDDPLAGLPTGPTDIAGQLALLLPGPAGRVGFPVVTPDDVPGLIRAYRTAVQLAQDTTAMLIEAGAADDLLGAVPAVDDQGRPTVEVLLTAAGVRRLARLLTRDSSPPPTASAA